MQERENMDALVGLIGLVVNLVAPHHAMADLLANCFAHVEVDAEQAGVTSNKNEHLLQLPEQTDAASGAASTLEM